MESGQLTTAQNLPDQQTLTAQLKSLRYETSRQTGHSTVQVDTNTDNPQIANADLVMALAMATWRMKTLYPVNTLNPPQRLPGFYTKLPLASLPKSQSRLTGTTTAKMHSYAGIRLLCLRNTGRDR